MYKIDFFWKMGKSWIISIFDAILRFAKNTKNTTITRQELMYFELENICIETETVGATPDATLSRMLQLLRDLGLIKFIKRGVYKLIESQIKDIEKILKGKSRSSRGERIIKHILNEAGINYVKEKTFTWLKDKGYLRLDYFFEIGDLKVAIEVDGQQHYYPVEFFGGIQGYIDRYNKDTLKNQLCLNHGIHMLRYKAEEVMKPEGRRKVNEDLNKLLQSQPSTRKAKKTITNYSEIPDSDYVYSKSELEKLVIRELKDIAKQRNIYLPSKLRKAEIITTILENQ